MFNKLKKEIRKFLKDSRGQAFVPAIARIFAASIVATVGVTGISENMGDNEAVPISTDTQNPAIVKSQDSPFLGASQGSAGSSGSSTIAEPSIIERLITFFVGEDVEIGLNVNGINIENRIEISKSKPASIWYSVKAKEDIFIEEIEIDVEAESLSGKTFLLGLNALRYTLYVPELGSNITITNPLEIKINQQVSRMDEYFSETVDLSQIIGIEYLTSLVPSGVYNIDLTLTYHKKDMFGEKKKIVKKIEVRITE